MIGKCSVAYRILALMLHVPIAITRSEVALAPKYELPKKGTKVRFLAKLLFVKISTWGC